MSCPAKTRSFPSRMYILPCNSQIYYYSSALLLVLRVIGHIHLNNALRKKSAKKLFFKPVIRKGFRQILRTDK